MNIEGKNVVFEAVKSGIEIETLLVEKGQNHQLIALARKNKVKIQFVEKAALDRISETGKHQGFIAKTTDFTYSELDEVIQIAQENGEKIFIVLLDGIEDPHNLGSILRVCECAGVTCAVIPKNRSVSVNETVIRTSAGAAAHVKVCKEVSINNAIEFLKSKNVWIYCADSDGEDIYKTDLTGNIAIVIGGEGLGVKRLTKELCDKTVSLPLLGKVNSLNASVACGIVVYEALRQRFK